MKLNKLFRIALSSLLKNRTRSFLTMLGVIIGVAAVIVMVAIGSGAQKRIQSQIATLGTNLIMIRSGDSRFGGVSRGAGSAQTLTLADVEILAQHARHVAAVSPYVSVNAQVVHANNNWTTLVAGVSPEYLAIRDWELAEGSFFTARDSRNRSKVAVIGTTVRDNLFPGQEVIGKEFRIKTTPFKIIGVLKSKGQSSMGFDQDDIVLAPVESVAYRLKGDAYTDRIYISARSEEEISAAQAEVTEILRRLHRLGPSQPNDFSLRTQTEITEMASATSQTMTVLLGSIAGVSLLVGGIGIMNIMLVSVTERTREIGIRLAVGARARDILSQFLVESIVLSILGGLIGVALAAGVCWLLDHAWEIPALMSTPVVFLSLGVSAAIGIFFGLYPARKAANLDPIEALRRMN